MIFFVLCVVGLVVGVMLARHHSKKQQISNQMYIDWGPSIDILGKTFIKSNNVYIYKGLVFASTNSTNWFGIYPSIQLSQQEFLTRLENIDLVTDTVNTNVVLSEN